MYYSWPSIETFTAWHTNACTILEIPHPGRNIGTGEIDPDAQWTTAYTEPVVVADDDVRAIVEDHVATLVPHGLGVPCDPPPPTESIDL